MKRRILIVDDDEDILDLLKYNLEREGYEVKTLSKSWKTLNTAKKFSPDLIILDIMMPEKNGIELCRKLRSKERFRDTYIFFLTASAHPYQQTVYHTGGDDYIEKMIGLKSLIKKISAVLKSDFIIRKSILSIQVGKLQIDRNTNKVVFRGRQLELNKAEFELLFFFAQNPSRDIGIDHIINSIWGSETYIAEPNVETYIHNLKQKFGIPIIHQRRPHKYNLNVSSAD
jgi:two-component system, OmpR family, alkaline phosphatase synthesis response regulator PhoP